MKILIKAHNPNWISSNQLIELEKFKSKIADLFNEKVEVIISGFKVDGHLSDKQALDGIEEEKENDFSEKLFGMNEFIGDEAYGYIGEDIQGKTLLWDFENKNIIIDLI